MKWYAKDQGNGQGLIIDEETGRNVAVAYDKKDAAKLAAAPRMLSALRMLRISHVTIEGIGREDLREIDGAIAEAEGR